jgi:hypothetical protein
MPLLCIYTCARVGVPYIIYIHISGLQCCCLERKAIPEPLYAEQQDCSPAFLIHSIESGTQSKQCPAFLCIVTYMSTDGQPTVNRQSRLRSVQDSAKSAMQKNWRIGQILG